MKQLHMLKVCSTYILYKSGQFFKPIKNSHFGRVFEKFDYDVRTFIISPMVVRFFKSVNRNNFNIWNLERHKVTDFVDGIF